MRKQRCLLNIANFPLYFAGPGVINGNNLTQGLIWEKQSAVYQTREGEINGVQGVPLEIPEAWPFLFQEQRGAANSWSKQGVFTGMAMQQCTSISAKDTSVGSPIRIPLASVSQQFTEKSIGVIQLSALWRKNEDSFSQLPVGVHSKVYTDISAAVDMPMQSLDSQSSSHGQSFVSNRTNGMDEKGYTSEFNWGKRFPDAYPLQSTGTQLSSSFQSRSLSSLGQDLRQSTFAGGSRSSQQQVAACAMPTSPHLPGFSLNILHESSGSEKCPSTNGMPPLQVYGGWNARKGSQVSCPVDMRGINEVDLTLGLSNRVINDAINSASDCFLVSDKKDNPCQDNIEKVNRTNKGMDRSSDHTNKGDPEECVGFTVGLLELPCTKDPENKSVEKIQPNKVMGIYDLLGKPLQAHKIIDDDWDANHLLTDKLVHRVVPLSRKESLESFLVSDSTLNGGNELNGNNGVKSGVLQAREGDVHNPGNLAKQFFYKQLPSSTDQNCRNKSTHSHTVAQLTGCDISINIAQEGQTSNLHGLEPGFSCGGSKQIGKAECQFMLPSSLQQIEIEAPRHINLNGKTTQCLGLDTKGGSGMLSMHIEMETKKAIDDREGMVERALGSESLHAQTETMPSESYFHEENADKFIRDGDSSVDPFLQASISGISHFVKPLKGHCAKTCNLLICNQKNQNLFSDEALSHSSPVEMEMVQKEEIENAICSEEADSKLTKCVELLAIIDKNKIQEDNKPALNFTRHSSCSAQLPELANAVKYGARNLSESTHLAAETLLRIVSEKNSRHFDVNTCHPQNSSGPKTTLEWFADMIPGDTDHLELTSVSFNEEIGDPFLSQDTVSKKSETGLCEDSIPEKMLRHSSLDFFESMTLMLVESDADEHCKPYAKDPVETENISSSVKYVSRTLKRGKRQRDFQREILPGISTLSRQKIAQDLQTIEVLIKSIGDVCQSGFTGRNGGTCSSGGDWFIPPKGRRSRFSGVSRASCENVETNAILPCPKSYNHSIDRLNGISFKSTWGETTRRKRMQRQRTSMLSSA